MTSCIGSYTQWFRDLETARQAHDTHGGYLLSEGTTEAPCYLVTEDAGLVVDLRGPHYVAQCDARQCWDESIA